MTRVAVERTYVEIKGSKPKWLLNALQAIDEADGYFVPANSLVGDSKPRLRRLAEVIEANTRSYLIAKPHRGETSYSLMLIPATRDTELAERTNHVPRKQRAYSCLCLIETVLNIVYGHTKERYDTETIINAIKDNFPLTDDHFSPTSFAETDREFVENALYLTHRIMRVDMVHFYVSAHINAISAFISAIYENGFKEYSREWKQARAILMDMVKQCSPPGHPYFSHFERETI